jgi:hypothetical protein
LEVLDLDVCDWLLDNDLDGDNMSLDDAIYVKRQKNDQIRQSMVKRFAFGSAEGTCLPLQMTSFMTTAGLQSHEHCQKWTGRLKNQVVPCVMCGLIFRKMCRHKDGNVTVCGPKPHALGTDSIQLALSSLLQKIWWAPGGFTAKSMRRGGLSTAKRTSIPAAL